MRIRDGTRRWPPVCLFIAIGRFLKRRLVFPRQYVGTRLRMDDGEEFTIFRHMSLKPGRREAEDAPAVLVVRFEFARFSQTVNRFLSLIPIPLIAGFPGFRDKVWTVNEDNGYWQGVYQLESEKAVEDYRKSFVLKMMYSRALDGSVSYKSIPNMRLVDYLEGSAAELDAMRGGET